MSDDDDRVSIGATGEESLFAPHGRIDVWREPPFVRLDADGPFNVELLQRYAEDMECVYRAAAADGPYVSLVRVRQSILMPPDAIRALAHSVKQIHDAGYGSLAVAAIVAADVEGRDLVLPRMAKEVYAPAGTRMVAFYDEDSARRWALAQLAAAGG